MTDDTDPAITITITMQDGLQLRFRTAAEISTWLEQQIQAFRWLQEGGSRAGGGVQNLSSLYFNGFNNIRQALNNWSPNPDNDNLKQQLVNHIQGFYAGNVVVRSDHEYARIASDIAAKDGPIAASAGFGFLLGNDCQVSYETLKGIVAAKLKADGIDPQSPNIVAKAIADLNSKALSDRTSTATEWDGIVSEARSLLKSTDEEFKKQTFEVQARSDATIQRIDDSVDASLESIRVTEATYKEQMKLQAPVEYWEAKAAKHATALKASRLTLIGFTILGSTFLLGALLFLTNRALGLAEKSNADTAIFLKFAAISAVVTTVVFWVGRVLLRIYLSDRHLLTDAEERIALIKTYLALSNDDKVESSDRALILAPLFRTAADGIVKEEGPDASVAGMIAKALDLRSGR